MAAEDPLIFSGVDTIPGLAQAKAAYQTYSGDNAGSRKTVENFWTFSLGPSQWSSLLDLLRGNVEEAKQRHHKFLAGSARVVKAIPDGFPILGHLVGGMRFCLGDREGGRKSLRRANRSCMVYGAGAVVGTAGVLTSGFHMTAPTHALIATVAGVAGIAAGMRADRLWFPSHIPGPIALSPGQRFDLAVMRFLDAVKATACMDLVPVLWPEYVNGASVWTEPITVSDAAELLTNGGPIPGIGDLNSGMMHSFVLLKTSKGHAFLTERLHDGTVIVAELGKPGVVHHFHNGSVMPTTPLDALERSQQGANLFAVKELVSQGPSAASLFHFAKAQSKVGYNLFQSNCQQYSNDVLEFVSGKGLTYLPNGDSLSLSSLLIPPLPPVAYTPAGVLGSLAYEASLEPVRTSVCLACLSIPASTERDTEAELAQAQIQRILQAMQSLDIPPQAPPAARFPGVGNQLHVYRQTVDEPETTAA